MHITSIKPYNRMFKQNSKNGIDNEANKLTISDTQSDEFISSKNTPNNKKNNIWKWLLGGAITAALIIGLVIEKKASNAAKAEKEAAEKAKKELEEKLKKEKEELEKKLKEEQKKWDDFFKNNPTNNNKNTSSSGNSTSSSNTNGTSSSSGTAFSSTSGKKPRQSVNTESSKNTATKEMVEDAIEKTKKINERNEQLKKEIENIENEGNAEFTEEQKMTLNEYREKIEKELKNASESQSSNNITEEQTQKLKELKKIMRENYRSNVKNVYSSTFQNSSKEIQKIKNALLESNENIILFYSPDRKVGNDLIYTSAKELDYIIKTVSIDDLNKNTFESYKSLLPNTNKKIIWSIVDIEQATPQKLSDIKEFINIVKDKSINGLLIVPTDKPITIEGCKNKKIILDSMLTEEDITQVLEQILKPFVEENINYGNLSKELLKQANGNFYSHEAIASIARKRIFEITDINSNNVLDLLKEQELLQYCKECKPDITREMIECYKK